MREEGQVELLERRPTDLARVEACRKFQQFVNRKCRVSSYTGAAALVLHFRRIRIAAIPTGLDEFWRDPVKRTGAAFRAVKLGGGKFSVIFFQREANNLERNLG